MLSLLCGVIAYIIAFTFFEGCYRYFRAKATNRKRLAPKVNKLGKPFRSTRLRMLLLLIYSVVCPTQRGETQTGATAPLAMPSTSGVITTASPKIVNAGPLGNIDVTGILSGFGYSQNHPSAGDRITLGDVSNGQVFVQKASGLFQYFLQAGVYNIPILGIPGISTRATVDSFYGPLPQAYLKIAPKDNFSFLIGKLPTLIGAEYTFSFENLNIERGILWNQENAISRGI